MKVAIVYPIEFGTVGYFGGGERYAYELARALATRVSCRLVVAGPYRSSRHEGRLRIETHRVWLKESYYNPFAPGMLASIADVDVVHCIAYGTLVTDIAVLAARLLRKKVFITDVAGRSRWSLARFGNIARFAQGLLPLSEFASSGIASAKPTRRVIYGGVDTDLFSGGEDNRKGQVLYVGRLLPHKGVDYLIQAMPDSYELAIVGRPYDGEYLRKLKELSRGKRVRFRMDADDRELADEMRQSSVAVLPSVYTDYRGQANPLSELFGLAVVEAMASETPVISTTVGSLPEIVEEGVTGLLVPPNDVEALRRAIERMIGDPGAARRMGKEGRRRVLQRFTWDRVAEACLLAYRELP